MTTVVGFPDGVPETVPARMVNEFVYCPRLFHLEWVLGSSASATIGLPGLRDRAPLRITLVGYSNGYRPSVFPVFVTGLHCGLMKLSVYDYAYRVFLVFVTGLHCGPNTSFDTDTTGWVFPVFVTGLGERDVAVVRELAQLQDPADVGAHVPGSGLVGGAPQAVRSAACGQ